MKIIVKSTMKAKFLRQQQKGRRTKILDMISRLYSTENSLNRFIKTTKNIKEK